MKKILIFFPAMLLYLIQYYALLFAKADAEALKTIKGYDMIRYHIDGVLSPYYVFYEYASYWLMGLQLWADEPFFTITTSESLEEEMKKYKK